MGELIGIVSLVVTILGFGGTIWQLARTVDATKATAEAVSMANRRMLLNHLLVLLPQIRTMESDLDSAMANRDHVTAIRTLVNFSHTANQIAALLEGGGEGEIIVDAEFIKDLRDAAKNSTRAKAALVSAGTKLQGSALKNVALEIADIAARCAGLGSHYQSKVA